MKKALALAIGLAASAAAAALLSADLSKGDNASVGPARALAFRAVSVLLER